MSGLLQPPEFGTYLATANALVRDNTGLEEMLRAPLLTAVTAALR